MRLAPGDKSGNCRGKVGEGAGFQRGAWKLKSGRIWIPRGMQFDVTDISRRRKGMDITHIDVGALSFLTTTCGSNPAVAERRCALWDGKISSSGEVAQEVSTLAPVGPLHRCGSRLR